MAAQDPAPNGAVHVRAPTDADRRRGAGLRIVYCSFEGRYSDSPRAVHEALLARGADHEHTWLADPAGRNPFPPGVRTAPYGGPATVAALEAADLVVANTHLPFDWAKRPGARYLQTWHGTPLKRIHHDVLWAPEGRLAQLDEDVARWDDLLSPNRASTERIRRAFAFDGPVHETGYPRNDALLGPDRDRVRAAVRAGLGIPDGVTAVLWTPTWRDDLVNRGTGPGFALPLDLAAFGARLGRDHVLLLRLHDLVTGRPEVRPDGPVRDVSAHPDPRDLYLAADLMVTDYSSTMFDFAVTGKPMVFFTYDLELYRDRTRGFYFDLEPVAPGPLVRTGDELLTAIAAAPDDRYAARYREFRETFCHLEDGRATDRVLDLLFGPVAGGTPAAAGVTRAG